MPKIDCRDVREAGIGGGPIDILFPPTFCLVLVVVIEGTRPVEGVPVRGVEAAELVVDVSCFVGDLAGDCNCLEITIQGIYFSQLTRRMLEGLRPAGLGLTAFILCRLPTAVSGIALNLLPTPVMTLAGLPARFGTPFLGGGGGG